MYAVIDIGSNTIRLAIYKIEENRIVPMLNNKAVVGLASYINKNHAMKQSGMLVAAQTLNEFKDVLSHLNIEAVFPFATASLRNIQNQSEVLDYLKTETGFDIRVLSGDEEAVFDYYGAVQRVKMEGGLLVDVGGGSTELVFYGQDGIIDTKSMGIGSLNLFKKYVSEIIPSKKEVVAIQKDVEEHLSQLVLAKVPLLTEPICAVGGTARAILKVLKHSKDKDISLSQYPCSELDKLVDMSLNVMQKMTQRILKHAPDRVHTFVPGLLILNTIAHYYGSETILTSAYGVREGYLAYVLEERGLFRV